MVKLTVFIIVLITFCAIDIAAMAKQKLKKEIVPYAVIAVLAGTFGVMIFTEPFRKSLMEMLSKLI